MPVRRLILDLDAAPGRSIAGSLIDESGRATRFVGWLGLAGALQATTERADTQPNRRGHLGSDPFVEEP